MENVVDFINSFNPKILSRGDLSGALELIHSKEELVFHPTKNYFNITDLCLPADFFMGLKFGKTKSVWLKGILNQGNKIHRIVQSWLKQHESYFGMEDTLDGYFKGISARGRTDGKILNSIVEIKSIKELPESSEYLIENYPQYLEQLAFYSAIDPMTPKENYLVFITRDYPYKIKSFKMIIKNPEKITAVLKRRIYLLRNLLEEKENSDLFGKCRYCNENYCNIKELCQISESDPLGCEIKDSIELTENEEFSNEIKNLREKYGENFEFYTPYNILHPRKFCLKQTINKEENFQDLLATKKGISQ